MKKDGIKRKRGDRIDGRWVKDVPGLNTIMAAIMPNRTEAEVYLHETFDCTEILKFIEKKNEGKTDEKMTLFHCIVTAVARMINERPKLNRFVRGMRTYERYNISLSFMCKKRFTDHSEEAMMTLYAKPDMTVNEISRKIIGDVHEARSKDKPDGGMDAVVNSFAKIPRPLLKLIVKIVMKLDYNGKVPMAIREGDTNFSTVLFSNLGSIKCPSVYHHLNNYGTNSIMITIGTIHKEELLLEDGHKEIRDVVDLGITLDERIADGFYFAKSLKLVKHIFAHPELLEIPISEESGFKY